MTVRAPKANWSDEYLGLPFADRGRTRDGVDCWGLVRLVLGDHGIEVPSYAEGYASAEERAEVAGLINGAKRIWFSYASERPLDVVTFRRGHLDCHVGIVVRPGFMLHVSEDLPACIEQFRKGPWMRRLTGVWRHRDLVPSGGAV